MANRCEINHRPFVQLEPLTSYRILKYQLPHEQCQWTYRHYEEAYCRPLEEQERRFRMANVDPQYLRHEDIAIMVPAADRPRTTTRTNNPPSHYPNVGQIVESTTVSQFLYGVIILILIVINFEKLSAVLLVLALFWVVWVSWHC